jgi:phosphoribosylglycinamide formyltransferase-1
MRKIVILISGRGSNMQAIVAAARVQKWPARIVAVISNRADAPGLLFAESQGIPTAVIESKGFASREAFDAALLAEISWHSPDLVVLAGFMRILTSEFVMRFAGRMVNVHPSLLPDFPGLATHRQALAAGATRHGATVHFVTPTLDHGPIIAQAVVPVLSDDTEASLAGRVLEAEHLLYPAAIRAMIEGRVRLDDDLVSVSAPALAGAPASAPS